jgi:REP element-mobilizing transposase RayT
MHDRRHPHRLEPEAYRNPGETVFVKINAGVPLACVSVAEALVRKMGRMDELCGTEVRAYVIMPNHLHVVVHLLLDGGDIRKWLRYFKREAARSLGCAGMWQRSFWDRHMRRDQDEETAVYYVLNNPARRGLCESIFDWPYSWSCYHPECKGPSPR